MTDDDINDEYERFVNGRGIKDSSTPNRHDEDIRKRTKEFMRNRHIDDSTRVDVKIMELNVRPKNYSTVSLPNYDELDVVRHATKRTKDEGEGEDEKIRSRRPVRSSTGSLPVESFLLPFSQVFSPFFFFNFYLSFFLLFSSIVSLLHSLSFFQFLSGYFFLSFSLLSLSFSLFFPFFISPFSPSSFFLIFLFTPHLYSSR